MATEVEDDIYSYWEKNELFKQIMLVYATIQALVEKKI